MEESLKLPELPSPASIDMGRFGVIFSPEQMQEHGLACARAALEGAANVCDEYAKEKRNGEMYNHDDVKSFAGREIAGLVRNIKVVE